MTSVQVAELLGVTTRTVRTWTSRGLLPHVRVGGVKRYRVADIDALLDAPSDREEVSD
jgi:excisionase family DNA binding protein